jgi:hypothetical protein
VAGPGGVDKAGDRMSMTRRTQVKVQRHILIDSYLDRIQITTPAGYWKIHSPTNLVSLICPVVTRFKRIVTFVVGFVGNNRTIMFV